MWPLRRRATQPEREWGAAIDRDRSRVRARERATEDARIWKDLALDAVFARIDRCVTALGQERLLDRLRLGTRAALPTDELARFDAEVRSFAAPARRAAFRRSLEPLSRSRGAADLGALLKEGPPPTPRWAAFFPLATGLTIATALAILLWPKALLALVGCVLVNIAIRLRLHASMTMHADALAALGSVVATARALHLELPRMPGERALGWTTMDVTAQNEVLAAILTYVNVFLLVDVNAFVRSLALVREMRPVLLRIHTRIGDLDAAYAIASFRAGLARWAAPDFTGRGTAIRAIGVAHPLVADAVTNDAVLDPADGWLVLGSNASGKSTFAKALGLQAVLAQSIATTTCASYAAPSLRVWTIIAVEDSLETKRSHFVVEAEAARDMLLGDAGVDTDRLCIVDELFRGTNTADRVAAGAAFLRALRRDGATVVAATHDAELLTLLDEYRPHYFTETVTDGDLVFDYRLREGAAAPRNALAVLALAGFPAHVLADARSFAERLPTAVLPSNPIPDRNHGSAEPTPADEEAFERHHVDGAARFRRPDHARDLPPEEGVDALAPDRVSGRRA